MKLLITLLISVAIAHASTIPKVRDLSKYQPRSVLFPQTTPPKYHSDDYISDKNSRITGGVEVTPNSYPWQAAVFIDDMYFCGGSLINEEWVLTAAHCAEKATSFEVVLGAHDLRLDEPSQVSITTTTYKVHPKWNSTLVNNDIALIKLSTKVNITDKISPIVLPPAGNVDYSGWNLTATGHGKPSDNATGISPVLREVTVPGLSNVRCRLSFPIAVNSDNVCIDTTGGKSTCNGDSGGPLGYVNATNNQFVQVGITSFGSNQGCEVGAPAVFARVTSFLDFISDTTGLVIA